MERPERKRPRGGRAGRGPLARLHRSVDDAARIPRDPPHRRTQAGLGRSFQVSSIFPLLSVGENVRLAAEARLGGTLSIVRRAARYGPALERAATALKFTSKDLLRLGVVDHVIEEPLGGARPMNCS